MNKCVNCTYTTENDEKFCPNCGGELIVEAAAEVVAPAPKGNAKGIVGVILSILGLVNALVCILIALISTLFTPIFTGIPHLIVGSIGLILSIVGLILSWKSSKVGKIIGIIAVVLLVLSVILNLVLGGGMLFISMLGGMISMQAGY